MKLYLLTSKVELATETRVPLAEIDELNPNLRYPDSPTRVSPICVHLSPEY